MPNHPAAGAVIYAKDITRLSAFYAAVAGLELTHTERAHVILESPAFQLVVLAAPPDIAASITIAAPPARRTNAAIKPVFFVRDIAAAREAAAPLGGELNPAARQWKFQGATVCDGHDPEGNVFQLRERPA